MNRQLLLRVTAPAVALGLALCAACAAGVWYVARLQANLSDALSRNVASLQSGLELQIRIRQLRLHSLLYLMDPSETRLGPIAQDERNFEQALAVTRATATTPEEIACVRDIEAAYLAYQQEQARLRRETAQGRPVDAFHRVIDTHPVSPVVDRCQDLLQLNRRMLDAAAQKSQSASWQAYLVMLGLGLAGPAGGLAVGYGAARGLSRSISRLSVRLQDVSRRLDRDVASVSLDAEGDLAGLDRQMDHVVRRVEETAQRLQRQQRELLRAEQLAAVGQLAAGVAHEVRNPLTAIKMLVELALRPRNPKPLDADDLRVIHREVARLERTVQTFLSFARLPAPERASCDLRGLVRQAADLVRARAEGQRVALELGLPGEPVTASVDAGQLSTVLVNLFLNALDAMPNGGRLEVGLAAEPGGGVRLTVADSGGGIAPQVADRLFAPFVTTKPTGTGLGLSLSARILEEHGGSIQAANRPEGGARFVVRLPQEASPQRHKEHKEDDKHC
jgi:signal transduction histidine kinase